MSSDEEIVKALINVLTEVRARFNAAMDRTNNLLPQIPDESMADLVRKASIAYIEIIETWLTKIESSESDQDLVQEIVDLYKWVDEKGGEYIALIAETERLYGITT